MRVEVRENGARMVWGVVCYLWPVFPLLGDKVGMHSFKMGSGTII